MAIAHVTSRDNALVVRMRKLARQPGAYREAGEALVEGEHLGAAWVRRRRDSVRQAIVAESAWDGVDAARWRALAGAAPQVAVVADRALASATSLAAPPPIAFLVAVDAPPAIDPNAATVVLDRLQDAGNVGSILRSAAAFGVVQVIALEGTALLWSPKVLRAAMGAHLALALVEGRDADDLGALAVPLVATSSHAVATLDPATLPKPSAWMFGNEGEGVAGALLSRCAHVVSIPQPGGEESLNVAAAAAICLYASSRA